MATDRRLFRAIPLAMAAGAIPVMLHAQDRPMSAIDWLSDSIVTPAAISPWTGASRPVLPPLPGEPPVSEGITTDDVAVTSLDRPSANAVGLLPAVRSGLPRGLWGVTPELELAKALRREQIDMLPATQNLLMKLLLTELAPPALAAPGARPELFLARIDKLLELGALEPALALLDQPHAPDAEIFRRHFDVALLLGEEDRACEVMQATPVIAPSYPARVFCLARGGDWETAALTFGTGRVTGQIDTETEAVLERFLEPELDDDEALPPPSRPSPLIFRMLEAIGQPLPTGPLPVAFAQADLRANTGWKARIEAGERLARLGVLDANRLLGLYTENDRAPSGGVWDRARAIAALDQAITAGDTAAISAQLPDTYRLMQAQQLEMFLASLWGKALTELPLDGEAQGVAFRLGLLSDAYETVARAHRPETPEERLMTALAQGQTGTVEARDQLGLMLKSVFDLTPDAVPTPYAELVPGQLGKALLQVIDDITEGARGDYPRVANGLRMLRMAGLEDAARRIAIELLVLERRG